MRVAIIGGGPLGVEAALYGTSLGLDVRLYEAGRLGENVRQWGHVRVFTEWARNRSPLAERLLREQGTSLPDAGSTSTGDELADYVVRLAALPALRGRIFPQTRVLSLGREACLRSDYIDSPRRGEFPFRLLLQTPGGDSIAHADAVIDATGVYATPNWAGNGGMPCAGEERLQKRIDYHIPDIDTVDGRVGRDQARFKGRHTLVIGSGHSAASTLRSVGELLDDEGTRLTWIVRRDVPAHGMPYSLIPHDSSPHRDALHRRANELSAHPQVTFLPGTVLDGVSEVSRAGRKYLQVQLKRRDGEIQQIEVDNIAAHTGFRPDATLWRELTVHVHPATDGPFALAQALIANNHRAGTGLSTGYAEKTPQTNAETSPSQGEQSQGEKPGAIDKWKFSPDDARLLESGEANFWVIGIKSYGRDAGFLMHNGFRQVRDVYKILCDDAALDLYGGALDAR